MISQRTSTTPLPPIPMWSEPRPWQKCPVCGGNGLVPNGFYNQTGGRWTTGSTTPEKCRSCGGRGIVR